jgi:hypothetical protein
LPAFLVDVPLFYGPVWLIVSGWPFTLVGFSSVGSAVVTLKLLNVGLLALTGLLLFRAAPGPRVGWQRLYLFLANPLVLFEGIGNVHNDVMMTLLLVSAFVALRSRSPWAGGALVLSALVKPFTIVLAPLFLVASCRQRLGWRRAGATLALCGGLIVLIVLPYWADGAMLAGWHKGTTKSQDMDHVSLLSLAHQAARSAPTAAWFVPLRTMNPTCWSVPGLRASSPSSSETRSCRRRWVPFPMMKERIRIVFLILFLLVGGAMVVAAARGWPVESAAVGVLLLFLLLLTNLYPWYLIPVFALLVMRPTPRGLGYLFVATTLGLAYYPAYVFARIDRPLPELQRHLFLALFLTVPILLYLLCNFAALVARRWRCQTNRSASRTPRPFAGTVGEWASGLRATRH